MDKFKLNNSFEEEMNNRGYKIYDDNYYNSIRLFQKKVTDAFGTRFYINCYHRNYYKQGIIYDVEQDYDRYSFEVQFNLDSKKEQTINISYSGDMLPNPYREVTTLDDVEVFFDNMFIYLNAKYYELNF